MLGPRDPFPHPLVENHRWFSAQATYLAPDNSHLVNSPRNLGVYLSLKTSGRVLFFLAYAPVDPFPKLLSPCPPFSGPQTKEYGVVLIQSFCKRPKRCRGTEIGFLPGEVESKLMELPCFLGFGPSLAVRRTRAGQGEIRKGLENPWEVWFVVFYIHLS